MSERYIFTISILPLNLNLASQVFLQGSVEILSVCFAFGFGCNIPRGLMSIRVFVIALRGFPRDTVRRSSLLYTPQRAHSPLQILVFQVPGTKFPDPGMLAKFIISIFLSPRTAKGPVKQRVPSRYYFLFYCRQCGLPRQTVGRASPLISP